jgi:RecJ-like exonuclease
MEKESTDENNTTGNLHKPLVGSSVCPVCNGDGWYADHAPSYQHDEDGQCCGYCPIQVGCEDCQGAGFVTDEILKVINKNMEQQKLDKQSSDELLPF